jgi:hypothetical protein
MGGENVLPAQTLTQGDKNMAYNIKKDAEGRGLEVVESIPFTHGRGLWSYESGCCGVIIRLPEGVEAYWEPGCREVYCTQSHQLTELERQIFPERFMPLPPLTSTKCDGVVE